MNRLPAVLFYTVHPKEPDLHGRYTFQPVFSIIGTKSAFIPEKEAMKHDDRQHIFSR